MPISGNGQATTPGSLEAAAGFRDRAHGPIPISVNEVGDDYQVSGWRRPGFDASNPISVFDWVGDDFQVFWGRRPGIVDRFGWATTASSLVAATGIRVPIPISVIEYGDDYQVTGGGGDRASRSDAHQRERAGDDTRFPGGGGRAS
uniref:Uncharacterized protein n=1 Tax=Alexandrium monilatum TaxID=311494 RepID=A0A7S4RYW8_9DINO